MSCVKLYEHQIKALQMADGLDHVAFYHDM